jgi:hypothetical protein
VPLARDADVVAVALYVPIFLERRFVLLSYVHERTSVEASCCSVFCLFPVPSCCLWLFQNIGGAVLKMLPVHIKC